MAAFVHFWVIWVRLRVSRLMFFLFFISFIIKKGFDLKKGVIRWDYGFIRVRESENKILVREKEMKKGLSIGFLDFYTMHKTVRLGIGN